MADLVDQKVILAVAQRPFESQSDAGIFNLFGTLAPVVLANGHRVDEGDFPNNGLVWWMLRAGASQFALPGVLVEGTLEMALQYDVNNPDKMIYQVKRDSVEPVKMDDLVEILTVGAVGVKSVRELLNTKHVVSVDHPPAAAAYIRWRQHLYGPFKTAHDGDRGQYLVSLRKMSPIQEVLQIPEEILNTLGPAYVRDVTVTVSLDPQRRRAGDHVISCGYEFVLSSGLANLEQKAVARFKLESNSEVLLRVSKELLAPRRKRQEFSALLRELGERTSSALGVDNEVGEIVRSMLAAAERDEATVQVIVEGLLNSGLLDARVDEGIDAKFAAYVQENSARAKAEIAERVERIRTELETLQRERDGLQDEITSRRRRASSELEHELRQRQEEVESRSRTQEAHLEVQRAELEKQRELLSRHLEDVAERFSASRDDVINQFLALEPLFAATRLRPRESEASPGPSAVISGREAQPAEAAFSLPPFACEEPRSEPWPEIAEVEFYERFRKHVKGSGYLYRDVDLASFHLSVKCSDMTVLGGVSGTGKSSLPRLYVEALAGYDVAGSGRYLNVAVSPSWLDMRDLLGHVNTLEGRFQPSEAGLYQHLIAAFEEDRRKGGDGGIYVACLDEMNLSHVEHYFSGILQALEQPVGSRTVRCFSPENVSPVSAFHAWAALELPRSLRFVGTVNLDETTKQLSARLLDRVNFIRLRPAGLPEVSLDLREAVRPAVDGSPVTLRSFRSWIRMADLDREQGRLIDEIGRHLRILGCPLNPRRYQAICRFVASAPPQICPTWQALDLQIAQRLIPQIRGGLFRVEAQSAVESIVSILEAHGEKLSESLESLSAIRESEFDTTADSEE